jgi:FixJ family two-component response regulator
MNIPKPFTDESMVNAILDQLARVTERHGQTYASAEELLGVIAEEQHELLHAIHEGKGEVTTKVLSELIDIAVVCVRGARAYLHGKEEKKSASDAMYESWKDWHKNLEDGIMPDAPNPSFSRGFLEGVRHGRS